MSPGRVFEVFLDPQDPTRATRVEERPQVGMLHHEGIAAAADGSVFVIDELNGGSLSTFVQAGVNVPAEDEAGGITGFHSPDNLTKGPDGRLWIVEDNSPSDIWATAPDRDGDGAADAVELFASLKDSGAEISGIYFGKDPKTLFFRVQHPDKALADGTWKVTRR